VRRAAWIFTVLAVLLLADGLWMQLSHYQPGDQNTFTGNANLILSDGQVVLISAGFLIVATVVMWVLVFRREALARQQQSRDASRSATKA
jgi:type VI protein secretion system component VasK